MALRVYEVTLTKEITYQIVGDSEKEVQYAFERHCRNGDIDDWDAPDWDININRMSVRVGVPPTPEMGVHDGECLALQDYVRERPEYLAELHTEHTRLEQDANQPKLPGI